MKIFYGDRVSSPGRQGGPADQPLPESLLHIHLHGPSFGQGEGIYLSVWRINSRHKVDLAVPLAMWQKLSVFSCAEYIGKGMVIMGNINRQGGFGALDVGDIKIYRAIRSACVRPGAYSRSLLVYHRFVSS